jgi:hypothetical protein
VNIAKYPTLVKYAFYNPGDINLDINSLITSLGSHMMYLHLYQQTRQSDETITVFVKCMSTFIPTVRSFFVSMKNDTYRCLKED